MPKPQEPSRLPESPFPKAIELSHGNSKLLKDCSPEDVLNAVKYLEIQALALRAESETLIRYVASMAQAEAERAG